MGSIVSPQPPPNPILDRTTTSTQVRKKVVKAVYSASAPSMVHLISACVSVAEAAGKVVRQVFQTGDLGAIDKDFKSGDRKSIVLQNPQTIADLQSQKLIIGSLKRLWPNLTIVGEEGELEVKSSETMVPNLTMLDSTLKKANVHVPDYLKAVPLHDITLFVDPLDGTKEFVKGEIEAVTILIGIAINGTATAGVIHVPFSTPPRTVWGLVGVGAFGANPQFPPASRRLIVTSSSHHSADAQAIIDKMAPTQVEFAGGAGNKGLWVLERRADAYVYPQKGTRKWDTCAVDAVIKAAGGKLTNAYGQMLDYSPVGSTSNDEGVVVTMENHNHYVIAKSVPIVSKV